jgi:peptidoglycan/xylan/chitin deacetylase (PgdA/CDA1 family)/SAM-dependent methyltransferase
MPFPLAPAHLCALGAFQVYAVLLCFAPNLAALDLAIFVGLCAVAPFLPGFSFFLPIVSRGRTGAVALTFDDGPDPRLTPAVLDLLDRHGARATFFMVGARAEAHPDLVREVLARGHTVGNHSCTHSPFLMLKSMATLRREIARAQAAFQALGVRPRAFRPPVGITNSRLFRVLLQEGMFCLNFNCRAGDMGNRRIRNLAGRLLRKVRPGSIVLLHDALPPGGDPAPVLAAFETFLQGLASRGLAVAPLDQCIGQAVMEPVEGAGGTHVAQRFYDGLAATYDEEQFQSRVSIARRTELALFEARIPGLFRGADRILELGAGTGIFTLALAREAREVVAADISPRMLDHLQAKCRAQALTGVTPLAGDVETLDFQGPFTGVCAFSALEYLKDLPALLRRLEPQVAPGGFVYFITARRSLFRLFTRMGNAMRQGIWLKAYGRSEMVAMLEAAGFTEIQVTRHLLKAGPWGGMLLEVVARRARV